MAKPKASIERRQIMLEMRARGDSIPMIASRFGLTRQRVYAILNPDKTRARYIPKPGREQRKKRRSITPPQICEIVNLFQAGEKAETIAEQFGISTSTVYRAVSGRSWADITGVTPEPYRTQNQQVSKQLISLANDNVLLQD